MEARPYRRASAALSHPISTVGVMSSSVAILIALLAGALVGVLAGLLIGAARAERSRSATSAAEAERFRELSASILAESQQKLVDMNATRMRELTEATAREDSQREKTVRSLVEPIDTNLRQLSEKLVEIEQSRTKDSAELRTTITGLDQITKSLQAETHTLATAMKDNRARGSWGEMQLQRVVELAGMIEHCDFVTQTTVEGDDGRLRPDLVVKLPQSRSIVIDAKVPMSAYLDAVGADDPDRRSALMQQHTRDLLAHVNELQRRNYSTYVEGALDFVVMFVPGDTFLNAAFEAKPSWFDDAISRGVLPASPGALIALLRAISYGWQQDRLAQNAEEIAAIGAEMHQRLVTFADKLVKVGAGLTTATKNYNEAIGSLESRVLVSARRFREKGVQVPTEIEPLQPLDLTTRLFSAPELLDVPTDPPLGEGSDPSA
ncbi:unannotated protein [freshwater metagenome]|uniref:Unannotated protein n=1 Tax=freshwater metagenome TaxID=449393 RepID=A0A6J5YFK1_9ZZZZ